MAHELLDALANETNQAVLSLLAIEPAYTRSISEILGLSESDVSRRLTRLKDAGLLDSSWERVDDRNVKVYRLVVDEVHIGFGGEGLRVLTRGGKDDDPEPSIVDRLEQDIPEPEGFVGRRQELDLLEGPEPVVLVEGIAGIGKTSLATAFAHQEAETSPVFFCSFTGTESLTWLAHRLGVFQTRHGNEDLRQAIEADAPLTDLRELALAALTDPSTVVVLDAIEQIRDEDLEALIVDAIERARAGKIVVSGRNLPLIDPSADQVHRLRLAGLSPEEVHEVLAQRGLESSAGQAEQVQRRLGGHPLAVNLFAEAAAEANEELDSLLERIPDDRLEAYLLEEVHEVLSESERNVLAYASVFHGPFSRDAIEAVYPRNPTGALVSLQRRRLLAKEGGRYRIHQLLRSFFRQRLDDAGSVHEAAAGHALSQDTLEARLDALHHLLEAGQRSRVLGLLERDLDLAEFDLIEDGYHNLYLDVLERLDPDRITDGERAGLVQDELGDIRYHRDEHNKALDHYRRAADSFQAEGASKRLADLAWKRALALRELDREDEAAQQVRTGLDEHAPDERTRQRLTDLAEELGIEP